MDSDFIDGGYDIFDPKDLEERELVAAQKDTKVDDLTRQWLNRRRLAYVNVFTEGKREAADVDIVLNDLMWFCKVWEPTYNIRDGIHAEELSKRKEGRREVFQRIKEFSSLDSDSLMIKYTDSITK